MRIEDTDVERSKPEFEKDILEGLGWLGINWDEIYKQSERKKIYKKYLEKLLEENKAYYCFCPFEELEAKKQEQISRGVAPKYNGKCFGLAEKEVSANIKNGKKFVIRLRIPDKKIKFHDLIRGEVEFDSSLLGDFAIAKNLETPLFYLAGAIDDYEMKITHVIRGEDHISNTPKQILIQEALDFPRPVYAHLPLILAPDKSKLSKRHGAVSLSEYRKMGYLAEAIINFLAFLGWNPGIDKEIYSLASLVKEFSLERVQRGGAVFNIKKLDFINGFYIRQQSPEKLTELCLPYLKEKADLDYIKKVILAYQGRMKKLSEIPELCDFIFKDKLDCKKELLFWKNGSAEETKNALEKAAEILEKLDEKEWNVQNLEGILMPQAQSFREGDRGYFLWPLRAALSGKEASAGPFEIAELLGKEKTLKRLKQAKELL